MKNRFLDSKIQRELLPNFVKRKHGFPLIWLVGSYVVSIAMIFIVTLLMAPHAIIAIVGTASVLLLGIMVFTSLYIHQNRNAIMATEFQNALFAAAIRSNSEFCLIVTCDGAVVYSDLQNNPEFSELAEQGMRGLDILLTHEGIARQDKDHFLKALAQRSPITLPFHYLKNEENGEPLSLIIEPINQLLAASVDSEVRPDRYVVIRAIKQAYSSGAPNILEAIPAGAFIMDQEHHITYLNKTLSEWLGYTQEILLSEPEIANHLIHFPGNIDAYTGKAKLNGKEAKKDVLLSIARSRVQDGAEEYYGIVLPNVPSDKKVVILPGKIDNAWEQFIEHSPIAVAHLDDTGSIIKYNKAFQKIAEYDVIPEIWNLLDIIAQEEDEVQQLLSRISATPSHEEKPIEITITGSHGTTASLYVWRMENSDGSSSGILAHLIDTTEQKNLELCFAHSQKMQAVGQLAGGIAHDFNNLLTAMMGFCDLLLLRHPAGDPSFADIMQIKQNANRAANLVRQLLAFSRKQTLQPEILDITDVLAELSNLIRRLIGENIELKISHGRDLGLIKVDQGQLEQVLINLAVNARDAMIDGGALTIQTCNIIVDKQHPVSKELIPAEDEVIEDGDYVLVEVIDTGHGIPKDVQRKIFEPFFSTKEVGSGTGLGLSTVYGIIKQTGGYVYVTSKEDQGTKFTIFLKGYKQEAGNLGKKLQDAAEKIAPAQDLTGKETILLVEDETPVRIFSTQALTNKGYTVLEADSGEAALQVVAEKGPDIDIIITDVIMPGMNGPTMAEEIVKQYPNIKVIFISGYAEDAFVNTYGMERKFNFLPKPFTLKQLASKVKEVIEKEDA